MVKNLRTVPRIDPQQYLDSIWAKEDRALDVIFGSSKDQYSLEELYKGAENVCRQGKAADLYTRLKRKCETHLADVVRAEIRREEADSSDIEVLRHFVKAWSVWQKQLLTVRQIFYYLDQTYLLRSQENPSVTETGLIAFRSTVFQDPVLRPKVLSGAVTLIDFDRKRQLNEKDSALLRQAIHTLHQLSIYTNDFEPLFQTSTEKYLRTWQGGRI